MKHQLTQQEIDSVFDAASGAHAPANVGAVPFDFRRVDRIPKSQVSAIHFLHETFVRSLSASLTLYLRSFVSGSLISVEQLPYSDFAEALSSPTCLAYANMEPFQGYALIEVNPSLISPVLDLVLGGDGKIKTEIDREVTEVEKTLLETFFQIITKELRDTWKPVAAIGFSSIGIETSPQPSGRFVPTEAVVAVAMEFRVGERVGMVNLAIPSLTLKTMGQKFEQQWANHRAESPAAGLAIRRKLTRNLQLTLECEYSDAKIRLKEFLALSVGHIIPLGSAFNETVDVLVNGTSKFRGALGASSKNSLTVTIE